LSWGAFVGLDSYNLPLNTLHPPILIIFVHLIYVYIIYLSPQVYDDGLLYGGVWGGYG